MLIWFAALHKLQFDKKPTHVMLDMTELVLMQFLGSSRLSISFSGVLLLAVLFFVRWIAVLLRRVLIIGFVLE